LRRPHGIAFKAQLNHISGLDANVFMKGNSIDAATAMPASDSKTNTPVTMKTPPPATKESSPSAKPTSTTHGPQHAPSGTETTTIEADTIPYDDTFSDAGYKTDEASRASTSISSSVRDYGFENSRRYHKFQEGRYQFPNDEPEQEREDMKHAMIVHLCDGKLHFAPLDNPQRILDVGTGTGIWAIDSKWLAPFHAVSLIAKGGRRMLAARLRVLSQQVHAADSC
jgi:hypothetical protein